MSFDDSVLEVRAAAMAVLFKLGKIPRKVLPNINGKMEVI